MSIAASSHPWFYIRKSRIRGAGRGLFLTRIGALHIRREGLKFIDLPFFGIKLFTQSQEWPYAAMTVHLTKGVILQCPLHVHEGKCLANFANEPQRQPRNSTAPILVEGQDVSKPNAILVSNKNCEQTRDQYPAYIQINCEKLSGSYGWIEEDFEVLYWYTEGHTYDTRRYPRTDRYFS